MGSRKNAMLTTEDRRWLSGEKTYDGQHAKQQRYQRRKDIRERVSNSILDFSILFDHLDEDERQKIFGDVTDDGQQWIGVDEGLREGVRDGLAFLLQSIGVSALMENDIEGDEPRVSELFLEMALSRAGRREGFLVEEVRIDIDATKVAIPRMLEDFESGRDLSPAELYVLIESGAVDRDAVQACLRDQLAESDVTTDS